MSYSVYKINRGINKPIEFKGLKAQYIWWLGAGLLLLLILFAVMYIAGVNAYICVILTLTGGLAFFRWIYRMNMHYGQHGLMKKMAKRRIPRVLRSSSREIFVRWKRN